MQRTVLITGAAGYIGSVLVRQLLAAGVRVRAVDVLRFGGESLIELVGDPGFEFRRADVCDRAAMAEAVRGVWAVVHLAAIVGDPACAREPELAERVNHGASLELYRSAAAAGVERFVFASTCSNYGRGSDPDELLDESSPLRPVSLYARTKVAVEEALLASTDTSCAATCLRFSTVYGLSPRPRFDLTVNEFTRDLAMGRELLVFGEASWRPYCHVRDLSRSVVAVLQSPLAAVAQEVFNVGATDENFRKRDIVALMLEQIPDARVKYVQKDADPRDYRVSFERIRERLGFEPTRRVADGIREVRMAIAEGLMPDPDAARYANVTAVDDGR